jgi:hypothetical protein
LNKTQAVHVNGKTAMIYQADIKPGQNRKSVMLKVTAEMQEETRKRVMLLRQENPNWKPQMPPLPKDLSKKPNNY